MAEVITAVPSFSAYGRELDRHVVYKIKQRQKAMTPQLQSPDAKADQDANNNNNNNNHHHHQQQNRRAPGTGSKGDAKRKPGSFRSAATSPRAAGRGNTTGGAYNLPSGSTSTSSRSYRRGGNFIFKCTSREQSPGFFHEFLPEKSYEPKYNPQHEVLQRRAPAFSIGEAVHTRLISDVMHPIRESDYAQDYALCQKNPLFKEQQRLQNLLHGDAPATDRHYSLGGSALMQKSGLANNGAVTREEELNGGGGGSSSSGSGNNNNNNNKKRDDAVAVQSPFSLIAAEKGRRRPHGGSPAKGGKDVRLNLSYGSKSPASSSPQKSLRSTAVTGFGATSPTGTATNNQHHHRQHLVSRTMNTTGVTIEEEGGGQQQASPLKGSNTVGVNSPSPLPNVARGTRSRSHAPSHAIDWSVLNELELANEEAVRNGARDAARNGWVQMHATPGRDVSPPGAGSPPECTNETCFNNYSPERPHPEKAHDFGSYTARPDVFPPRFSPEYNLLGVNYDRLLPRPFKGDARFERYAAWRNTKFDNMDDQPMGRLDYTRKEQAFDAQCEKHVSEVRLARLTARKDAPDQFWPKPIHGVRLHRTELFQRHLAYDGFKSYETRAVIRVPDRDTLAAYSEHL